MTDSQRALLNIGLKLIENPILQQQQISWVPEGVRPLVAKWYADKMGDRLGREIVMDAIARAGYFAEQDDASLAAES